jgi:single-strand selective monofunctional uracil DNA glycosylase
MTELLAISRALHAETAPLRFAPPVAHVYHPLDYAWSPHARFVERYGKGRKPIVLLGMNPGPFGMAQTGVPFGEIGMVRDWLRIDEPVGKPAREHPKRPIEGFACARSEVSGKRLWGWAQERFRTPQQFFARFWVHNYCPLVFMADSGRNLTPDKLPVAEREPLFAACDRALRAVVAQVRPQLVIGVGQFAEQRARSALGDRELAFGRIPHPSPASPLANKGWAAAAERALADLGV